VHAAAGSHKECAACRCYVTSHLISSGQLFWARMGVRVIQVLVACSIWKPLSSAQSQACSRFQLGMFRSLDVSLHAPNLILLGELSARIEAPPARGVAPAARNAPCSVVWLGTSVATTRCAWAAFRRATQVVMRTAQVCDHGARCPAVNQAQPSMFCMRAWQLRLAG
jgi:hypothetical protein